MKYLELIHKFWEFNNQKIISSSGVTLYFFLLEKCHKIQNENIIISDIEINSLLGLTRPTIQKTKKILQDLGLIEFKTKNGLPTEYKIVIDYDNLQPKTEKVQSNIIVEKKQVSSKKKKSKNTPKSLAQITPQLVNNLTNNSDINIPTFPEFLEFSKTLPSYNNNLDAPIKEKYEVWKENNWRSNAGKPITNWQNLIAKTLPFLDTTNSIKSLNDIPKIERP